MSEEADLPKTPVGGDATPPTPQSEQSSGPSGEEAMVAQVAPGWQSPDEPGSPAYRPGCRFFRLQESQPTDLRNDLRKLANRLYTANPFYVISAALVFAGLRISFDPSGPAYLAWCWWPA